MAYDPVGFLNTSIATALAFASAGVLFAMIAPDTPKVARRRFVRVARKAFERIGRRRPGIGLNEFETSMTEALDQLRRGLEPERGENVAVVDAGIALLGAGRELIRIRDGAPAASAKLEVEDDALRFLTNGEMLPLDRARRAAQEASAMCLTELREDRLGVADVRCAAREMIAFAAVQDELERAGELLPDEREAGVPDHVA
jgi:uncharacterized membrane protein YccC